MSDSTTLVSLLVAAALISVVAPTVGPTLRASSPLSSSGSIPVGTEPTSIVFDPANGDLYVTNSGSGNTTVISGATRTVVGSLSTPDGPNGVTYDATNQDLLVVNSTACCGARVAVFNASDDLLQEVLVPGPGGPDGAIAVDAATGVAVVQSGSNISLIDLASQTILNEYRLTPDAMAYDPTTNFVYLADALSGVVEYLNGSNESLGPTVPIVGEPSGIAVDPAEGLLFVTGAVALSSAGNVSIVSIASGRVLSTVGVGALPRAVAFDSSEGELFVANSGSDNVSVIGLPADRVLRTLPVGLSPRAIAVDAATGTVFVVNSGSDNVSYFSANNSSGAGSRPPPSYLPFGIAIGLGVLAAGSIAAVLWRGARKRPPV